MGCLKRSTHSTYFGRNVLWLALTWFWPWALWAITIHLNVPGVNASDWLSVKNYLSADNIDPLTITELHMSPQPNAALDCHVHTQFEDSRTDNTISTLPDAIAQLEFLFLQHN
ncbi:MAG: hypothetical protein ACPGUZ_03315 [Holosporaceae bacterium]